MNCIIKALRVVIDRKFCFITAEVVAGSAAWLGRSLSCVCVQRRDSDASSFFYLTLAQEECLQRLQRRIHVPYDSSIIEHQEALRALWNAAFPEEELRGLISEQGGGFISLENFLFFARNFPDIDKKDVSLSKFKGKVLLIVNVASRCGLTSSNYTELSHLYENFKDRGLILSIHFNVLSSIIYALYTSNGLRREQVLYLISNAYSCNSRICAPSHVISLSQELGLESPADGRRSSESSYRIGDNGTSGGTN
ncbi:unnamed protein product [Vicia faba]|uniref:Glutathione peroxidase n=1 Tax=Vicia faba TaxID=3906 RepID=A0AAV1AJ77_VICFA|nr:unnamed protein product [Vicia faba]